jgi:hypothetical protein
MACFFPNTTQVPIQPEFASVWVAVTSVSFRVINIYDNKEFAVSSANIGNVTLLNVHIEETIPSTSLVFCACEEHGCSEWKPNVTFEVSTGATQGSLSSPLGGSCLGCHALTDAVPITQTLHLNAGWNWFHTFLVPLTPTHIHADLLFESRIGSQYGDLVDTDLPTGTFLSPLMGYKAFLTSAVTIQMNGWKLVNSKTQLAKGWNWLSFHSPARMKISDLDIGKNCFLLKDRYNFTQFYYEEVWFGTLKETIPGRMHKIKCHRDSRILFDSRASNHVVEV